MSMNEYERNSTKDDVLVKAFQEGDMAAFDQLVIRHKESIFNLCYWFLGDYQDANDYAQETFIKVYRSLKRFRGEAAFSTWLYRIAVNTCKNRLKSVEHRYKQKTISLDNPDCEGVVLEVRDESQKPNGVLEGKQLMLHIREAINGLPRDQKTVIVLRDIQGLSYEEIIRITGLPLGTVKSKIARARQELRRKLRSVIKDGV